MSKAKTLKDLLIIRDDNIQNLLKVKGFVGSALGFKYKNGLQTDKPAILVFVGDKIYNEWLEPDDQIPVELKSSTGLFCPTDVIEAGNIWIPRLKDVSEYNSNYERSNYFWFDEFFEEYMPRPLTEENLETIKILRGWSSKIYAGSRIAGIDIEGDESVGTISCFVKHKNTQKIGVLTNAHVAGEEGAAIRFPSYNGKYIGVTVESYMLEHDEKRFNRIIDKDEHYYKIDCSFSEIDNHFFNKIDPTLYKLGKIGKPLPLDLNSMDIIGQKVASVGSRRGVQKGKIFAFGYETYRKKLDMAITKMNFTDYLIIGEEDVDSKGRPIMPTAFSGPGDSGKLIVTDDDKRNAVALLWGGVYDRNRKTRMFEDWSYGIDINYVLDKLDVEIYTN